MIAALSPAVSWLLFGACVATGAVVYVAIAGRRDRTLDEQTLEDFVRAFPSTDPALFIHVTGGVYDAVARGDFDAD